MDKSPRSDLKTGVPGVPERLLDRRHLLVGGKWERPAAGGVIEVVSPSTEEAIGTAPEAGPVDVDRAVQAARAALDDGWWGTAETAARADVLDRAWALLSERLDGVPELVTAEMGVPITSSRMANGQGVLRIARYATDTARVHPMREEIDSAVPAVVLREPVGVVAAIAPWNGPFNQAMYKVAYPLLAGCPVVFKPSPETPLDAFVIAEALMDAGLPEGLLSVLPGGPEVGRALVAHRFVDKVSFTGSAGVGREIGSVCGSKLAHAALELGGKSAAIVFDDADLEAVVPSLIAGVFSNAGQVCAATSRILVSRRRHENLVEGLVAAARALRVGDPFDERTQLGPLVAERQRERVESYVALGLAEGARLVTGGRRPAHLDRGWFIEPTVFDHVDNRSRLAQEEIFGPVVVVSTFDDHEQAIALANDTVYGLNGSVYTQDEALAFDVARRIRAGTFTVNGFCINMEAPFGGRGDSGLGRKFGFHGLESFFELKTINLPARG